MRVKRAFPRVIENSVFYAVGGVASGEDRIVKQLILAGRDIMCRIGAGRIANRNERGQKVCPEVAGCSSRNAVVIRRELLCLLESLFTAGGTTVPVGVSRG